MATKPPTRAEIRAGVTGTKPQTVAQRRAGVGTPSKPLTVEERRLSEQYGSISGGREVEQIQREIKVQKEKLDDTTSKVKDEIKSAEERVQREKQREREARTTRAADRAEEKQVYYREYVKRLRELLPRLEQGYLIEFRDIQRYAKDYARYEQDLERASQRKSELRKEAKQQPNLQTGAGYGGYIDPNTGLGYSMLPETAKDRGYIPASKYVPEPTTQKPKEVPTTSLPSSLLKDFQVQGAGAELLGQSVAYPQDVKTEKKTIQSRDLSPLKYESKPSDFYGQGTPIITPLSPEQIKIREEAQYKGDLYGRAALGVPAQMLGGIFTKKLTDEQYEKTGGAKFFNPKVQFEIYKENFDFERDVKKAVEINKRLEELNRQYEKEEITYSRYEAEFTSNLNTPEYQAVINAPKRQDIYQRISESNLPQKTKDKLNLLIGAADFLTFAAAPVRVVRGADALAEGFKNFEEAETKKEKIQSGVQIGVGGLLTASGVGGGSSIVGGLSKGGVPSKTSMYIGRTAGAGFGGVYGYGVYKETGDTRAGIFAGLGAAAGAIIPGEIAYRRAKITRKENIKIKEELKKVETAEVKDVTFEKIGKGKTKDSTLVEMKAIQETKNFRREIKIKGDLIKTPEGTSFIPQAEGTAIITGKFKPSGTRELAGEKIPAYRERIYVETQKFNLAATGGKPISIGKVGDALVTTSGGSGLFTPRVSTTQVIKAPRNKVEFLIADIKTSLKGPTVKRGGQETFELTTPGKEYEFKLNDRLSYRRGTKSEGVSIRVKEQPKEIGFKGKGRKTPFEKTFKEQPKQETIVKDNIEKVSNALGNVITKKPVQEGKPRMVGGQGLTEVQMQTGRGRFVEESVSGPLSLSFARNVAMKGVRRTSEKLLFDRKADFGFTSKFSPINAVRTISRTREQQLETQRLLEKQKAQEDTMLETSVFSGVKEGSSTITGSETITSTKEVTKLTPGLTQVISPGSTPTPIPRTPSKPPKKPIEIINPLLKKKRPKFKKEEPYDAYIRRDATNFVKARWEKINRIPLTKESALGLAAKKVDNDISARFKIEKRPPIVTRVQKGGKIIEKKKQRKGAYSIEEEGYFKQNRQKFRGFFQESGVRKKLPGKQYIEKEKYRLDTPGERRGISVGRVKF